MKSALLAALVAGFAIAMPSPTGQADINTPQEQRFVDHMLTLGVPFRSVDDAINAGYGVCLITIENTDTDVAMALIDRYLTQQIAGRSTDLVRAAVAGSAINTLCP